MRAEVLRPCFHRTNARVGRVVDDRSRTRNKWSRLGTRRVPRMGGLQVEDEYPEVVELGHVQPPAVDLQAGGSVEGAGCWSAVVDAILIVVVTFGVDEVRLPQHRRRRRVGRRSGCG